ncbi:FAD/NAD(P)-binding domain-containing protein [Roridomyces roridus]|uniref:FAD/NAD(P)-binding domain-containing protein n=1 Tax=Roridomyces roridus TaxID=1738132 RepID=A0AAD7FU13_9AGAR|nr:FAD/NAD(P)-binding domain-containing protein [Roridomyces roridus]
MGPPDAEHNSSTGALSAIVVGAGLVGFAAAVALRRQGHRVTIYESSSFSTELGAGLAIPSNTLRCLIGLGCVVANLDSVDNLCFTSMAYDGTAGMKSDSSDYEGQYGTPWVMAHRVDLHNELRRLAIGPDGTGPPAVLHLVHRVVSCDVNAGSITLADGSVQSADLIIGADGIRSTIRRFVLGEEITIPPSGTAGFRWLTHATALDPYPELDWIVKNPPMGARVISAPITPQGVPKADMDYRTIVIYACRGGSLVNVLAIHEDSRHQDSVAWNAPITREALLDFFGDYHPRFKRLLELAEDVHVWQMRVVPPLRTWVNGRVGIMGDAAHASLPTLGQGFGMGLEDAVALGVLLPSGTAPEEIPDRLQVYERLRKERAEYVSKESFDQQKMAEKRGVYLRSREMRDKVMGYDVKKEAEWLLAGILGQK